MPRPTGKRGGLHRKGSGTLAGAGDAQTGRQPGTMPTMKGMGLALVLVGALVALGLGLLVARSEGLAQGAVTFAVGGVIAYIGFETFNRARDHERGAKVGADEAAPRATDTAAGGPGPSESGSDS
jgi:threonine/homoserine/homoserine lactone efflux protein